MGNQVGTAAFQVGDISPALGVLNTANGLQIPAGQALVQDPMAPQQYFFSSSATQSYTTQLTCPDTAIVTNQATLTAATGQTITQTATVQKLCYDLQVRVAQAASPFVGKWSWDVRKETNVQNLRLKPSATAWDKYVKQQMDLAIASGQDPQAAMELITGGVNSTALSAATMDGSMTGEVTYKVGGLHRLRVAAVAAAAAAVLQSKVLRYLKLCDHMLVGESSGCMPQVLLCHSKSLRAPTNCVTPCCLSSATVMMSF